MNAISPWQSAAAADLDEDGMPTLFKKALGEYTFIVLSSSDALYIYCRWKTGRLAFRPVYSPDRGLKVKRKTPSETGIAIHLESAIGNFSVNIGFSHDDYPMLTYTTTLSPRHPLHIPYWPRDIVFCGNLHPEKNKGTVHVKQVGTRSGLLHFSLENPEQGSILYLQNLSALADYNQDTQTSAGETVVGIWPEIGFSLPVTKDQPLQKNKTYTISDAIVVFEPSLPQREAELTRQYLNLLAAAYLKLPQPKTTYIHWPEILEKGLKDLNDSPGCWSQVQGKSYFNAYVSDYQTPPEIMVQLAVLLPIVDYLNWSGERVEIVNTIKENLPEFWDEKLKTVVRWLPAAQDKLLGEEEQKKPMVMDSWYLHHPLLNLSRLALMGDKSAEKLFLDSLPYATKVARHFRYNWPVFYKMDTLEVIKAETKPGEGGQHDVAGLYTHVMLQAYELTEEKKYLTEAEKAAKSLQGKGFKLFYQANNTTFSAGALLRLHKLTTKKTYLELSYLCLGNLFQNVQLWDCNYGYGKHFPTFFAMFPLSDAPYTAVYEEQEVFCALHDYLEQAKGLDILPSVNLLCNEYIRHLINRACYYYPPMLPTDMLSAEVKIGEVDPKLWIALEDLQDGWSASGQVGQEVYGAGNAFGILPRHYHKVKGETFLFYADYPITGLRVGKNTLSFQLLGDARLSCRFRIITQEEDQKLSFTLTAAQEHYPGIPTREGHTEFTLAGNQRLTLAWRRPKTNRSKSTNK